jgi:flagellar hook-associated protein FlgK
MRNDRPAPARGEWESVADLEVDLDLLGETAGSLGMLMHEFTRAADIVEDAEAAIGRNALLEEMRTFVSEWKHNRQKLIESIDAVYKMADQSRQAYIEADNQLAHSIQDATQEGAR